MSWFAWLKVALYVAAVVALGVVLFGCAMFEYTVPVDLRPAFERIRQRDDLICHQKACLVCDLLVAHGDVRYVLAWNWFIHRPHVYVRFEGQLYDTNSGSGGMTSRREMMRKTFYVPFAEIKWPRKGYRPTQAEVWKLFKRHIPDAEYRAWHEYWPGDWEREWADLG